MAYTAAHLIAEIILTVTMHLLGTLPRRHLFGDNSALNVFNQPTNQGTTSVS